MVSPTAVFLPTAGRAGGRGLRQKRMRPGRWWAAGPRGNYSASAGWVPQTTMPAPTVSKVASSMMTKAPVARFFV